MELIYVADPLCSWCYGFAPTMARVREAASGLPVRLVMGGLRAGNRVPMDDKLRAYVLGHWEKVHAASGQPFDFGFNVPPGFVYDTEPPCRAVKAAQALDPGGAFPLMGEIQRAFYREGRDVTRGEVLAEAARRAGLDEAAFREMFESPAQKEAAAADFSLARSLGVTGFPTLLGRREEEMTVLVRGWLPAEELLPVLDNWMG